jgi:rubrerythrin
MAEFKSVDEALDFAIKGEQEAYEFYSKLAEGAKSAAMKDLFSGFAKEEQGHKAKLESIKTGKLLVPAQKQVADLKMSDYLVEVEATPDMSYQDALIVAMKKEKAAFKLYSDLAAATADAELKTTFLMLAQEEAKHKLRFEILYDDEIMTEN